MMVITHGLLSLHGVPENRSSLTAGQPAPPRDLKCYDGRTPQTVGFHEESQETGIL